jgi:hypothetical protein
LRKFSGSTQCRSDYANVGRFPTLAAWLDLAGVTPYDAAAVTPEAQAPKTQVRTGQTFGPWSASWVRYYDQHSRRRHHMGGYRRLRALAKRKRRVELITLACTSAGVLALVGVFYTILTR